MAKRRTASEASAFKRFMRVVATPPPQETTAEFAAAVMGKWSELFDEMQRALWVMPANERYAFARAIAKRAQEWAHTPGGEQPAVWPVRVVVEQVDLGE